MKSKGEIIFIVVALAALVVIGVLIVTAKPKKKAQETYESFSWNTGESKEITTPDPSIWEEESAPETNPVEESSIEIKPEDYITPTASAVVLPAIPADEL